MRGICLGRTGLDGSEGNVSEWKGPRMADGRMVG